MKLECRRDQPNQGWLRIQVDSGKVAVALEVTLALMAADPQPVIHGLNRQLNVIRRLQLDYHKPAAASDAEQI